MARAHPRRTTLTFKASAEQAHALRRLAHHRRCSLSALVRELTATNVTATLAADDERRETEALALMKV